MKKLLILIVALCSLAGIVDVFSVKVLHIFADSAYTVEQKKLAIEVVVDQLSEQFEKIKNGEDVYADKHVCIPH